MITAEQVQGIIKEVSEQGLRCNVKDISAVILSEIFEDKEPILKTIFGDGSKKTVETYFSLKKVSAIKECLKAHRKAESKADVDDKALDIVDADYEGITYDELKKGMEEDLRNLIAIRDNSELTNQEMVQVTKQIADLRVRLTEKFGTTEAKEEQRVVVLARYNEVCPYCHHEVSVKKEPLPVLQDLMD